MTGDCRRDFCTQCLRSIGVVAVVAALDDAALLALHAGNSAALDPGISQFVAEML
jgi:hypothetical protein